MLIRKIQGHTAIIGADQGYLALPIRTEAIQLQGGDRVWNTTRTLTAWEPTPKELDRINAGHSIIVSLVGLESLGAFPPIELMVENSEPLDGVTKRHGAIEDLIDSIGRYTHTLAEALQTEKDGRKRTDYIGRIALYDQLIEALQKELAT